MNTISSHDMSLQELLLESYKQGKTLENNTIVFCILPQHKGYYKVIDNYDNIAILTNNIVEKVLIDIMYLIPVTLLPIYKIPITLN